MQLGSPVEALVDALASALMKDLPEIEYDNIDWDSYKKTKVKTFIKQKRRPEKRDVEVIMFPQTWGSTALGYGGVGGASMTPAYTVIIRMNNDYCVYFGEGGYLAYKFNAAKLKITQFESIMKYINTHSMPSKDRWSKEVIGE